MAEESDNYAYKDLQTGISKLGSSSASPECSSNVTSTLDKDSPLLCIPATRNKSSFLTPCRRVGLKRKSTVLSPCSSFTPKQNDTILTKPKSAHCSHIGLRAPAPMKSPISAFMQLPEKDILNSLCSQQAPSPVKSLTPALKQSTEKRICQSLSSRRKLVTKLAPNQECKEHYSMSYLEDLQTKVAKKQQELLCMQHKDPKMCESTELAELTGSWRGACQSALEDLLMHVREEQSSDAKRNMDMQTLLRHLDIPAPLVHFDPDKEEFY